MKEAREWKAHVDAAFEKICAILDESRYLDHEIRAVEDAFTEKRKAEGSYRPYIIKRKPTPNLGWNTKKGSSFIYDNGAEIWYLREGTRLQKMLTVGHELGHIYLEHLKPEGPRSSDALTCDRVKETQATYFAKKVVGRRSDNYMNEDYLGKRRHTKKTINDTALQFQRDYDEEMLDPLE